MIPHEPTSSALKALQNAAKLLIICFLSVVAGCAYNNGKKALWGEYDYVAAACSHREASKAVCDPEEDDSLGVGRTKSGGKR